MSASNWVHLNVEEIVRETDKAFLVRLDGEEVWLPKGQMADASDYSEGDMNCTMSISEWIASEKGLS